jgi:ubiquinone/menaquinone biosynthesis C-methylase UbiE
MGAPEFFADQLRNPTGFFGRVVMSRFFDRSSAAINQLTMASLALGPADRVLEVGFGSGDLIAHMAPVVREGLIAGVDFSPDMVAVATKRLAPLVQAGRVELRCASAEALPYDEDEFTKACTVNTVYFWPQPAAVLGEFARVLAEGGRLVIGFSPAEAMRKMPKRLTGHGFTLYEPDDLRRLLEDAGFGGIEMVPGHGPRGEFLCAIGKKGSAGAD